MKIIVLIVVLLFTVPLWAGQVFVSYQATDKIYDDDNLWNGRGFCGQGVEAGYSWKYSEIGAEYYCAKPKTLFGSTFLEQSVMGTIKVKYPLPWKWLNRITPYAVFGLGGQFFTNKDMKVGPQQQLEGLPAESIHNKSSVAMKYGGGVQYNVYKNVSVFVEVANRYSDTGEPSSIDTYGWSFGGGARVNF